MQLKHIHWVMVLFLMPLACTKSGSTTSDKRDTPVKTDTPPEKRVSKGEYNFVTHEKACKDSKNVEKIPENLRCTYDSECGVCHDGSSCGTVMRVDAIKKSGDQCKLKDAAECELFGVHCCQGRCVTTALSGECKKGAYWVVGKCY